MGDFEDLREKDQQLRDAEMNHDTGYFEKLLSNDLVFRRASGKFVSKSEYLQDLPLMNYELLECTQHHLVPIDTHTAYTISRVVAIGKSPDGGEFEGTFINVRFFRKCVDNWILYAWHNTIATSKETTNERNFTGDVSVLTLEEKADRKDYQVFFHPGARTFWHIHTQVQKLFVVSGTAFVVLKIDGNDKYYSLSAGEDIAIPPGIMHWHGASPQTFMIHVACNKYNDLANTYWFKEVTDEEYKLKKSTRNHGRNRLTI